MSLVNLNDNVLPLIPNDVSGSPTPMPLVTATEYRKVTKDTVTSVDDVEELIEEVFIDLAHECRRTWVYGNYTEAQYLYDNGMVYPSASPIDTTKAIYSNDDDQNPIYDPSSDNSGSSIIQGDGTWVGWFSPLPWMPFYTGVVPAQTVLRYWGGFMHPTQAALVGNPGLALPPKVKRNVCKMVFYRANPTMLQGMPAGVKSMSVNGVSISGNLSSMMDTDPGIRAFIKRWRHPQAYHWQS